jgi:hypothetical protein
MIKLKNLLKENMRRFGTKNLNEDISNNIKLKRIQSNKLSDNEQEDTFVVTISYNGAPDKQYKIEVYRFVEDDDASGTTVYFQDEDIMDNEDSIDEFNGVENQDVYQAVLDFYDLKENMRQFGTKNLKETNSITESEESDKNFAEYIFKSYLEDAKQSFSAAGVAYMIMMDTDSKISPRYIKHIMKKYYNIDLK